MSYIYLILKYLNIMNPREIIAQLNLNLDVESVDYIMEMVNQPHLIKLQDPLDAISIYAITCLVMEQYRLLAVDNYSYVSPGLPTERFFMHVPAQIRLPFIEKVSQLSLHWQGCEFGTLMRIKKVESAYVNFQKWQEGFHKLSQGLQLPWQLVGCHFKIVWLAYIDIKQSKKIYNTVHTQQSLLKGLFRVVFSGYFYLLDLQLIDQQLKSTFLDDSNASQGVFQINSCTLHEVLLTIFKLRSIQSNDTALVSNLFDINFASRFVDDFYKAVVKKHKGLGFESLDETAFLEVDISLAPMPIKNQECFSPITTKIYFYEENDEPDNQSFDEEQVAEATESKKFIPRQFRISALHWVQEMTSGQKMDKGTAFLDIFREMFGERFDESMDRYSFVMMGLIKKYAPQCSDIQGRCQKVIKIFLSMMNELLQSKSLQQIKGMFVDYSQLGGFLFVSFILLNYVYRSGQPSILDVIHALGMTVEKAFIPLNWIGLNTNLPIILKEYLFAVEIHMLLLDLWQGAHGYQLITRFKEPCPRYLTTAIEKRLRKHVSLRIRQLCEDQPMLIRRVQDIVDLLIDNESILLKCNSINIIIISAYAISTKKGNFAIPCRQAINKWKGIDRFLSEELEPKGPFNNPISFDYFVNDILLKQLKALQHSELKEVENISLNVKKVQINSQTQKTAESREDVSKTYAFGSHIQFMNVNRKCEICVFGSPNQISTNMCAQQMENEQ